MLGISKKASEAGAQGESGRVAGWVVSRGDVGMGPEHIKPRRSECEGTQSADMHC